MRNPGEMSQSGKKPVRLAERRVFTESFTPLYKEGMGLVEETASYLDTDGRAAAKTMTRAAATLYAAESMRLTTRLMQLASWLLLQRAARSGEMTMDQVSVEKKKIRLDTQSASAEATGWDELPERFRALVDHSLRLQGRVRGLDDELYGEKRDAEDAGGGRNAVTDQIQLLRTAFGNG
jgi:regulator of CtrA degradation